MYRLVFCSLSALFLLFASVIGTAQNLSGSLPDYRPSTQLEGRIISIGSDTLEGLMTNWADAFLSHHPGIEITIQAAGSSTAPPALTEGNSSFGPMSRKMNGTEEKSFVDKYGYAPTAIPVAIDALAVYVHAENPIQSLSIPQLDAIFSSTRACGHGRDLAAWGDTGAAGKLSDQGIHLYGRNSVSGTYGYFKNKALCKGNFKTGVKEQAGSLAVVEAVSRDINGIGYSGMGYKIPGVKILSLSPDDNSVPVEAEAANVLKGDYPLSRFLYVYVNKPQGKKLAGNEAELIRFILSKQGQSVVSELGYIPLPANVAEQLLLQIQ